MKKACSKCKENKPLNPTFFPLDASSPSGYRNNCRTCKRKEDRERKGARSNLRQLGMPATKEAAKSLADGDWRRAHEGRYKDALRENRVLEAKLAALTTLREAKSSLVISPRKSTGTSEATAIACFSDVHIGERVTLSQTNGLNEYNVEICKDRCRQFFERIVRLTEKERQDVEINELILFLGGDLIDGALHLDTIHANEVSQPMEQAVIAKEIIEGGLRYLDKHGGFSRITVVCKDGNHGRITHKLHHASRTGNSLEWFLYYSLRAQLPQFNWIIEDSLHSYVKVYDLTLRFHHGDTISFGGTAGFYQFINRRRYQWNTARRADIDVLGHLHQYTATKRFVVNGSVVGYNPYAVSLGAEYEKPMQAYFLIDKKRGMTVTMPIMFDR